MDCMSENRENYVGGYRTQASPALAHVPSIPISTGTTLVACEYADGVVFGADSRQSAGSMVTNRYCDKLTKVTDTIYACRSGASADTQAITDIVKYRLYVMEFLENRTPTVERAAEVFRQYCYDYRDDFTASILVAGWDKENGAQVYCLPIGGFTIRQRCAVSGSGSTFIQGYMDSNWKPNMTLEECMQFVKKAVALAMLRDGSSGGMCRLGIVTEKGIERKSFRPDTGDLPIVNDISAYTVADK